MRHYFAYFAVEHIAPLKNSVLFLHVFRADIITFYGPVKCSLVHLPIKRDLQVMQL